MKRLIKVSFFVACFLLLVPQLSHAQYRTSKIEYGHGGLVTSYGERLSDREVRDLVGGRIYDETYTGAVKQLRAGKTLVFTGIGVTTLGTLATMSSIYNIADKESEDITAGESMAVVGSLLLLSAGSAMLDVGIPFWVIGKKRLKWVAEECNSQGGRVNVSLAPGHYGYGVVMTF